MIFSFVFFTKSNAASDAEKISTDAVINVLHEKFSMFILLQDINQSLHTDLSGRVMFDEVQVPLSVQFDKIMHQVVLQNKNVRNIEMMRKEKEDTQLIICRLAVDSQKKNKQSSDRAGVVHDDVQDLISIVSDPEMQQAAQVVSSFAVSMSHADMQQKSEESTESYVLRMFVMVFVAAQESGVIQKIPVLLEGSLNLLGDIVEVGEVVVHKVTTKCCSLV
jgi:peroxiredoxin family protein